jgi:Pilus formation protein N terminal region
MHLLRIGSLLAGLALAFPAMAQNRIVITLDKAELLSLERDAKVVMLADPKIADPVVESPRQIFLIGRSLGETNLHVLDRRGREIFRADVIVVPPDSGNQVSINRGTRKESTLTCAPRCMPEDQAPAGTAALASAPPDLAKTAVPIPLK